MLRIVASASVFLLCMAAAVPSSASPALIVFGDSTVDTGTNCHVSSSPHNFRADRYPYGFKAFDGKPTGRFSEGRVIVDFIAEYAGLPPVEAFLKPGADLSNGVNFGSGGAGALADTNKGMVLELDKQLENFMGFCERLSKEKNIVDYNEFFSDAVYLISIGSNDYLSGYFSTPKLQAAYTVEEFVTMVVSNITKAVEVLHSKGACKFVIFGVGPLGCIPPLRAFNETGGCFDMASALGQAHNYGLASAVRGLRYKHPESQILAVHFYNFFLERQGNPEAYGFKEPFTACCGAGPYRGRGHCGITSEDPEHNYKLCDEPSHHIWWDPYHPSESVHRQFAEALWSGSSGSIEPFGIWELFKQPKVSSMLEDPVLSLNN